MFYNIDNATPTPKAVKHIFANGADLATIQGRGADAIIYYNSTDSLNSSSIMTDSAGAIAETMDYYPFGSIRLDTKPAGSTFTEQRKYIGQEYDEDTGLNYLNARYYNSDIARFTSQDPMFWNFDKEWLADPQNQNSYSYARNNPIISSDPSGESSEVVIKKIYWNGIPIPGAHGDIEINPELGSILGDSKYTIGGYISGDKPDTNRLKIEINKPSAYSYPESRILARIPLVVPEGMSVDQYDQRLLGSGYDLTETDLGEYTFPGHPISSNPNSGNAWTQVVLNAGGVVPKIPSTYYASGILGKNTPYFPLGSGNSLNTPSYGQQAISAVKNAVNDKVQSVLNSVSSTLSQLTKELVKANKR